MSHQKRYFFLLTFFAASIFSGHHAHAELSFGTGISFEYDYQSFSEGDADLVTLGLSPNISSGNWFFALDIPWQKVDGSISLNQRPRLDNICSILNSGRPLSPRFSNLRNSILQYCSAQTGSDGSGLSDIGILASYGFNLGDWFSSISASYQSDNGDSDKGLGSGTQDGTIELTLQGNHGFVSTRFSVAYNMVLGGELEDFYDNTALASFSLSSPIHKPWVFGTGYQYQQASASYTEDLNSIDIFGEFNFKDHYSLRVSYLNYLDAEFYPDYSISAAFYISF